jgi:hypothetical protein
MTFVEISSMDDHATARWSAILALVLTACSGCGKPTATVQGHVTFNGTAVPRGALTFVPADGNGPASGATIRQGEYYVAGLLPGKKRVQILGGPPIHIVLNSEEARRTEQNRAYQAGAAGHAAEIPPNAEGNNVVVEIAPGTQSLEFALKAPAGSKQ